MISRFPRELAAGDVYFSPMLAVIAISLVATWLTVVVLNKLRWSRFVIYPSATFMAMMVFYVMLIDLYWIKI